MDSPRSPPGSVRRHGRNTSQPLVRRSTRGPLDAVDNPLVGSAASPTVPRHTEVTSPAIPAEDDPTPTPNAGRAPIARPNSSVDLRFLQDSRLYHVLPSEDVAPPFLSSEQQPPLDTPLVKLLRGGHFRRAAETAAKDLSECSSNDADQILQLLYTRLACLILVSRPDLAAQEAGPLTDLLGRNPLGATDIISLVPWELRLLLVRLQSLATADGGRRGVMALYALAGEVRAHLKQAYADGNENEQELWKDRLRDLGLRVADALVEMGELETANRHLDSLTDTYADEVTYRKAVLRIRVGDVVGAHHYVGKLQNDIRKATLGILLKMADGQDATSSWQDLLEQHPNDGLVANNLAVSSLYAGDITDARQLLEQTLGRSPAFAGVLFNISTIYELCSERAVDHKTRLAHTLAAKLPESASGGWDRAGVEFKL